jgi:RecB family endonuclease NucS
MTDEELKELVAGLAKAQAETEKQIQRTNKQLGELGNRLGGYMEHLIYPSMEKVLADKFKMTFVGQRVKSKRKGHNLELDVFGYSNDGRDEAVIVEIKARFDEDSLQQLLSALEKFPKAFPDHADKKLYGIVAAVDIPENMRQRVLKHGLYLARISDESFRITVPRKFQPKDYNHPAANGAKKAKKQK